MKTSKTLFIAFVVIVSILPFLNTGQEMTSVAPVKKDEMTSQTSIESSQLDPSNRSTFPFVGSTGYNMRYKMTKYEKAATFVPFISGGITSVRGYFNYENVHRFFVLNTGTVHVFNSTSPFSIRYNVTYWDKMQLYTANFTVQKSMYDSSFPAEGIFFAGIHPSSKMIMVNKFSFSDATVTPTLTSIQNYTIPIPSGFSLLSTSVEGIKLASITSGTVLYVHGRYVESTGNFPFMYYIHMSNGTAVDLMRYDAGDQRYKVFDDVILKLQIGNYYIVTNKKWVYYDWDSNVTIASIPFNTPISFGLLSTFVDVSDLSLLDGGQDFTYYFTINQLFTVPALKGNLELVQINTTDHRYKISNIPAASIIARPFGGDTILSAITDLANGQYIFGSDKNGQLWNSFSVTTGENLGAFEFFFPVEMLQIGDNIEIPILTDDYLYIIQLSDQIEKYYEIGNARFSQISQTSAKIRHVKGRLDFELTVFGTIQRNPTSASEFVEVGIMPVINKMFATRLGMGINGVYDLVGVYPEVLVTPKVNFFGVMNDYMEYYLVYDCVLSPLPFPFLDVEILDLAVACVAYERYSNGTYTQQYLNDPNGRILRSDWELETSVFIEDSHLLDELHVFSDGIEYDPYRLFFIRPFALITVTDKITNDLLYNETRLFSDPLIINIPSKYEFFIRYFSNFDKFGFDFSLLNTFVNGTQISSPSVRVLSPNARIVVKDFSGSVVRDVTVNKYDNGTNINVGLDVVNVIFMNRYNFTISLFLSREQTIINYQLPAGAAISLRLALGDYRYIVTHINGTELIDDTFELEAAFGVTIGSTVISFGEPTPLVAGLTLDDIIAISLITLMLAVVLITFATLISRARGKSPQNSVFGNKPKPKSSRPNGGYLRI